MTFFVVSETKGETKDKTKSQKEKTKGKSMREVVWTDDNGKRHVGIVRDNDPDRVARFGIQKTPPDLSKIDWREIERELHNTLVDRNLFTWEDLQKNNQALSGAILTVTRRKLIQLYKEREV